ncbi:MAG: hypothetical protein ACYDAG_03900 [Chloroflexota bacterium]
MLLLVAAALFSMQELQAARRERARQWIAAMCQASQNYDRTRSPTGQLDVLNELARDARKAAHAERRYAGMADGLSRAYDRVTGRRTDVVNLSKALTQVRITCNEAARNSG